MKKLNGTGKYITKRQAQPISTIEEGRLWELGLLGDSSPAVLLNTIVWQIGLYFALRSNELEIENKPSVLSSSVPTFQISGGTFTFNF